MTHLFILMASASALMGAGLVLLDPTIIFFSGTLWVLGFRRHTHLLRKEPAP